jgi:hypothetical protein
MGFHMEKEKILRQLEDKLLPSVKNLEQEQATEHDFFPALMWTLLEKSKDSEKSATKFEQFFNKIEEKIDELNGNKILIINQKIEELKNAQLKTEKKFTIWFSVFVFLQIISIVTLAVILLR